MLGITTILSSMVERKIKWTEWRTGSASWKSLALPLELLERTDARTVEMAKLDKVCLSLFMLSIYNVV